MIKTSGWIKENWEKTIILFLIILNLVVWIQFYERKPTNLKVYFFDVGQGDAVFIDSPTHGRVLVDGGPNTKVLTELGKVLPFGDRRIDVVIETHPDKDHIGGLYEVVNRYEVKNFLEPGVESPSKVDDNLKNILISKNIPERLARRGMKVNFNDGVRLEILFPDTDVSKWETNQASVVARLIYGEKSFLLTGDSPKKSEYMIMDYGKNDLKSDVLKVGHHGSKTSTSIAFASSVHPEYAVISAGFNNRYGHPHKETIDTLNKLGAKILSTIERGTIEFETDGVNLIQK